MVELTTWDALLRTYVDGDGRVDYRAWQAEQPRTLSDWLALQSPTPQGRRDHLAHWINLYNAFTIQAVLSRYPIASIRPTLLGLPNWIGFLRFFQQPVHRLGSQAFSLAQIENQMLRAAQRRPSHPLRDRLRLARLSAASRARPTRRSGWSSSSRTTWCAS